jgi:acyl dehydratase
MSETTKNGPRPLDEETIEAVRRRIGIPNRRSRRALNEVSSSDSFRHFARAYGDDNRLYSDPAYAATTTWGSSIAPPLYPLSAGVTRPAHWSAAEEAEMSGGDPLAGIGQYMCGDRWIFLKPVRAGDILLRSQSLFSAELRQSKFAGGTGALVSHRISWEGEDDSPFAYRFLDFWHADRERSRRTGKYSDLEPASYTDDDMAEIDALYAGEEIRGSVARHVRDVRVGDALGPIVKGPLAVTDIICWHIGIGMGEYGVSALKLGYQNRQRVPRFYQKNEHGYWDVAQRCHWDYDWARQLGQPAPYDYGVMRTAWMAHLVANWMGDDAWIWKLSSSIRKFNYLGDVHRVSGVVQEVDPAANTVTIDLTGVNQRGDVTCDGRAVVILPTTDGRVELPEFRAEDVPEAAAP